MRWTWSCAGVLALTLPVGTNNYRIQLIWDFRIRHPAGLLGHPQTKRAAFERADISRTTLRGCRTLGTSQFSNGNAVLASKLKTTHLFLA